MMAVGVLRAVHEAGLRVPEDVSVAGLDDIDICNCVQPPLTTVRQDPAALGAGAVQALFDLIGGSTSTPPITLPTELVVRASTGAPPAPG
jgi:DNA-binding LacI/PurR family transcriptional regulator